MIDAFALSTSTVTASPTWLLPAMVSRELFALVAIPLFFEDLHRHEFIRPDLIEGDPDAEFQCRAQIERAPDQDSGLAVLRFIDLVQRAVAAPLPIRSIRAELRIAELVPPERPVDEIAERGTVRPLPC